ncbi:hypothetical protein E8E13_000011 [Curvularia kusanoi]|uniref:F-box domain-containing protein n=1 Tax=Curvularia kusanoi TaxID=90978 RepID=A0A9P4W5X2_CURKU|nr:hypothetical protein E8E13_000011 [Curvularia kusanoi]
MVSLIDLLSNTYAPVQMMILPYLDVADVIALTLTCKGFDQLQPTLKVTSYDVNRFLKRFFDDPLEFRSVQAECGAIIVGAEVRNWFSRSTLAPCNLEIHVADDIKIKTVSWAQKCSRSDLYNYHMNEPHELLLFGEEGTDIKELSRKRRIGDEHTWTIELNTTGLRGPKVPDAVLESTTYSLRVWSDSSIPGLVCFYSLDFDDGLLQHPVLKHSYIVMTGHDSSQMYYNSRTAALCRRLNELTRVEITKMPERDRPAAFGDLVDDLDNARGLRDEFVLPDSWTFYDDDVIAYLDKAWKVQQSIDKKEEAARKAEFKSLTS